MGHFAQPEELSIATIFKGNNYIIPIYQRSYAWEKDQIEQLITDISGSKGRYYLGSLIVDKIDSNLYSVIDGQQRLTTIFLLLSILKRELISQNSLKFEAREKSNRTLVEIIKSKDDVFNDDCNLYSEEILKGRKIIIDFFENKDGNFKEDFCERFKDILIIRAQVPKNIDLNHYFEIMNTRGEQLKIHEIAKGRLLGKIENEKHRDIAAKIWDACSQMDSYVQMNFDISSRGIIFDKDWNTFEWNNFNELAARINISTPSSARFSLEERLKQLEQNTIKCEDDDNPEQNDEENERFETTVSFQNFLLIVNEAISSNKNDDDSSQDDKSSENEDDSSLDDKKFIEILQHHWENNKSAINFIFNMLKMRFLFDQFIIKKEYAKDYKEEGRWSLQKLTKYHDEHRKQDKPQYGLTYGDNIQQTQTLRLLQSALRITYTSPKTMHWISKALTQLAQKKDIDLVYLLERYACSKIKKADYKNVKGFGIDRIVFTYLDYVLERDKRSGIDDFQFQFRTSIEHFYPQHPIDATVTWEDEYLHRFGNLALITVSGNSKFSNLSPKSKVESYPDTIKLSPKLNLMKKLMEEKNGWTKELVEQHEQEMFKILDQELAKFGMTPASAPLVNIVEPKNWTIG